MIHVYMDNILISTPNDLALHQRIIHDVLDVLEAASFYLQVTKCVFETTCIKYLGLLIDRNTLKIDPTKLKGIQEWPEMLATIKQVQSFLGVIGYHQPWIEGFAHIARPLTNLQKKNVPFIWDDKCREALQTLKRRVTNDPVLWQPDHSHPFILEVDASQYATSAILWQEDDKGKKRAIGYNSSTLSDAE
jgi:RNase H-like domain found in reverse transcriptase